MTSAWSRLGVLLRVLVTVILTMLTVASLPSVGAGAQPAYVYDGVGQSSVSRMSPHLTAGVATLPTALPAADTAGSSKARTREADSRVAAEADGAAAQAAAFQGKGAYPGVDAWENATLKAGTVVHAGEPGLTGFATSDAAAASVGNDTAALNQGLQIAPRAGSYRSGLTAFRLTQDVKVGRSFALANSQFGAGGLEQFFIPGFEDVTEPLVTRLMFGGAP